MIDRARRRLLLLLLALTVARARADVVYPDVQQARRSRFPPTTARIRRIAANGGT